MGPLTRYVPRGASTVPPPAAAHAEIALRNAGAASVTPSGTAPNAVTGNVRLGIEGSWTARRIALASRSAWSSASWQPSQLGGVQPRTNSGLLQSATSGAVSCREKGARPLTSRGWPCRSVLPASQNWTDGAVVALFSSQPTGRTCGPISQSM